MTRRHFVLSAASSGLVLGACGRADAQVPEDLGSHLDAVTTSGMRYRVFLPPGYNNSNATYSVLYHLHGASLSWGGLREDIEAVADMATAAVDAGTIDPMIIVAPHDETGWSMWSDSHDGTTNVASQIMNELIPTIDADYRTWPVPECRMIEGFSMGGFGAATLLYKFPHLFGAGIVWDGAMHDWDTLQANRPTIARNQFGGSKAYFDQWSPWATATEPGSADQPLMVVRGAMGTFYDVYTGFISEIGHQPTLVEASCGHNMGCLADTVGDQAMAFLAQYTAQEVARD